MERVSDLLKEWELDELVPRFEGQRVNTFGRLMSLNIDLVKELIPEIGVRAEFLEKWSTYKASMTITSSVKDTEYISCDKNTASVSDATNTESSTESLQVLSSIQPPFIVIDSVDFDESPLTSETNPNTDCLGGKSPPCSTIEKNSLDPQIAGTSGLQNITTGFGKRKLSSQSNSQSKHLASCNALEKIKSLDIEEILKSFSLASKAALWSYKETGLLKETHRSHITAAVVQALLAFSPSPTSSEYKLLAEKVVEVFPTEDTTIYYYPPAYKNRNAKGKFPDKVKNLKYTCKQKLGVTTTGLIECSSKGTCKPIVSGTEDKLKVANARAWLKHNSDPWPEVIANWKITHRDRYNFMISNEGFVQELYNLYPILKLPNGYLLFDEDFKSMYPNREEGLLMKWDIYKKNLWTLIEGEVSPSDAFGTKLIEEIETSSEDCADVILLTLLSTICAKAVRGGSTKGKSGKGSGGKTKGKGAKASGLQDPDSEVQPTTVEARKSFILHVKVPGDIDREVNNLKATLTALKLRLQPFVIVVGPSLSSITASYVQIDSTRYCLRTPLKAVDACFKAFHTLNAEYPKPCANTWLFIQRFFYEMVLEEDVELPRVKSLICSLNGLISKTGKQ